MYEFESIQFQSKIKFYKLNKKASSILSPVNSLPVSTLYTQQGKCKKKSQKQRSKHFRWHATTWRFYCSLFIAFYFRFNRTKAKKTPAVATLCDCNLLSIFSYLLCFDINTIAYTHTHIHTTNYNMHYLLIKSLLRTYTLDWICYSTRYCAFIITFCRLMQMKRSTAVL